MEQYTVTGMSCAACSARVEKAVSKVPGVESCSVSLLTNSMGVEGSADAADIIAAVKEAGYGASVKGSRSGEDGAGSGPAAGGAAFDEDALADHDVGLAGPGVFCGQSCGRGPSAASAVSGAHGDQPEIFYQRL